MNRKRLRLVMEESSVDATPGHLVILEYWHVDPAKIKKVCNSRFFWNACEVQQSGTETSCTVYRSRDGATNKYGEGRYDGHEYEGFY